MTTFALTAPAQQWEDANGNPYVGAKLFTYVAGSTTKKTTYEEEDGVSPNENPIILNARGEPSNGSATVGVWGTTGPYKLVLAPATDSDPPQAPYWTIDNVTGVNDVVATPATEWAASGLTPTYISANSFSFPGDQTAVFAVARRLKITLGAGSVYASILTSSFGAGITTITLSLDSTAIDNTISAVAYGFLSSVDSSVPNIGYGPPGEIVEYAGTGTPARCLPCDGSNVSRSTYNALFAAIGTTWGVGDGSTTFGVPDFRRRVTVGSGGTGSGVLGNAVGNSGGAETVNLQHTHAVNGNTGSQSVSEQLAVGGAGINTVAGHTHGVSITSGNGGSTTQTIMQPSAVVGKFIRY